MGRFATASEFESWVRSELAAGREVDALGRRYIADEAERFWSRVVNGAEHDYWQGYWWFGLNDGRTQHARRWLYERHLGRKLVIPHDVVETSCGDLRCIRLQHLRLRKHPSAPMTQGEAIQRIRATVRQLGDVPIYDAWDGSGMPSRFALRRLFGSIPAAIEAAGFEPRRHGGSTANRLYSDDQIRQAITERAALLGRTPTDTEWERERWSPSYRTISRRFGSITKALA